MSLYEGNLSVAEFAKYLNCHPRTARRILLRYSHLLVDLSKKSRSRFGPIKRHHAFWRIPRSVAERIYRDLIGD